MYIKNGWESRYDYEGMSNTEKYLGRKLHTQDNCWEIAKVGYVVLTVVVTYTLITEFNLNSFIGFFTNYLS